MSDRAAARLGDRVDASYEAVAARGEVRQAQQPLKRHWLRQHCTFRSAPTSSRNPKTLLPTMTLLSSLPTLRGVEIVMQVQVKKTMERVWGADHRAMYESRSSRINFNQRLPQHAYLSIPARGSVLIASRSCTKWHSTVCECVHAYDSHQWC